MLVNETFINYYKENLQLTNEEFDTFIDTLQKPLPYIFRVDTPSLNYLFENNPAFTKIDYFKDIYQCDVPTYKKLPNREIFTNFILIGKLYRQELVSMIPVHYLDIKEDNSVLDMCAAPGSKSTQIIKMLKTGYLVSNDVNRKRAEILKSHMNNYNKCNVMITNNDARNYPKLKFDRILCDVPCSGDGTMRKNYTLRKTWKKGNMFAMQYAILKRGLEMLNDDGTLVYSTCSFNPVENEAVIQRAVIELGCEIVKVQKIEGLKMRNGLKTWNPMVEKNENNKWIFPMDTEIGLENCMRILPHDNDTGGFFVTVLKRQPKAKKSVTMTHESRTNDENAEPKNAEIENSLTDTPFYASPNNVDTFYNVSEDTKRLVEKQFDIKIENKMITQSIHCNQISIITDKLYDIINTTKALNIISGGCKSFMVNGHKGVDTTSYRAKVGILNVLGFKHDKVYMLNDKDANLFLDNENVVNEELSFKFGSTGICVVKFRQVDEYICVWVGRNTSNLLVDKHYKKAMKSIMQ